MVRKTEGGKGVGPRGFAGGSHAHLDLLEANEMREVLSGQSLLGQAELEDFLQVVAQFVPASRLG